MIKKNKKTQYFKFINLFLFLLPLICLSQSLRNNRISKDVWMLSEKHTNSYEEYYENGEKMLDLARCDEDRAKSYGHMADAKVKLLEFTKAIQLLDQADYYARKSNFDSESLMINYIRTDVYKKLGLNKQSDESWNVVLTLAEKLKDPDVFSMIYENDAVRLESKDDYCNAIKYRLKIIDINNKFLYKNNIANLRNRIYFSIDYDNLTYNYLKCNKLDSAKIAMTKADYFLKNVKEENHHLIAFHYLCKGIVYSHQNNTKEAQLWFNKAFTAASSRKNENLIKLISQEALLSNVYKNNTSKQNQNLNTFIKLNNRNQNEISKYTEAKIGEKDSLIKVLYFKLYLWICIAAILICIIVFLSIHFHKRKKKSEIEFQKIIKKIEDNQQKMLSSDLNKPETSKATLVSQKAESSIISDISEKADITISEKKEKEILENLQKFEIGEDFNNKNFTLNNLSTILGANSYYTSQIIKQHKHKNFNNYINSLRVNYIVEKLYNDSKYRNFKIGALSEMVGFSSQSRFAEAFKKEFGMSPSEFISKLNETN